MSLFGKAAMMGKSSLGGGADPSLMVGWHSAYWADSSDMNGYANGASVTTWYDQIGAEDLTAATAPVMVTSDASFSNHKSVHWTNDQSRELIIGAASASGSAQPVSLVVIGKYDSVASVNNSNTLIDGGSTSNRMLIRLHGGPVYAIFAGTSLRTGGTPDTSPHCFMARFNHGANTAELEVDGVNVINAASAGSHSWDGMDLGYAVGAGTSPFRFDGRIVFAGIYFGNVESDGGWATFKTWVGTYYGISVA
jgi:hypothetical protein